MLKIKPPNYKFCPFCGNALKTISDGEKERKYCPKDNWTYYPNVSTSVGAIIAQKGKVLLVKRNREPYRNKWMFPSGFVEFGEHPEETILREVREETGLKVKKIKLIKVIQSTDDPRERGHFIFVFKVEIAEGKLSTDNVENRDISWHPIGNPPKMGFPKTHQPLMKMLQTGKI